MPLSYSGMDCATDSLSRMPYLEVAVSGHLVANGEITDANLCVLGEL